MRLPTLLALASLMPLATTYAPRTPHAALARVAINDNRLPAGTLRAGVLTVDLEAREGEWHPDADSAPGLRVRAFAERGKLRGPRSMRESRTRSRRARSWCMVSRCAVP